MNHKKILCVFVTCCVASTCLMIFDCEARAEQQKQHHELEFKTQSGRRPARMASGSDMNTDQDNKIPDEPHVKQNEIDDRITIAEPYKSILQTTARFALAQTQVTKHMNIDTAMNLLNDAGYFLSKPVVFLKTLKVLAVSLATFLFTLIFFPGANKFAEAALQDPLNALNLDRYFGNGMEERSVLAALGSTTDETLSRVGLRDNSCRQRSICYLGEIMKCSFPRTADALTKFASDNFSGSSIKENVYARAFISGFVDKNCTNIGTSNQQDTNNCLGNFFNSLLGGASSSGSTSRKSSSRK